MLRLRLGKKRRIVTHGRERLLVCMLPLYNVLIYLASPVALLANVWRGRRDPSYRDRLGERFGFTRVRFDRAPLWVHAVSVGEVQAGAVLIRSLRQRYPDRPVLVTTGTPTGAQRVKALFGDTVSHAYLPYDTPDAVQRFLERVRPQIAIVMETEIWPNLFRGCRKRGIPIVIASARLSEKSVRRYSRLRRLAREALDGVVVAAQTLLDAERFRAIGAARVEVIGNLKFDMEVGEDVARAGRELRAAQIGPRPVWLAASTHEGEEDQMLAAHEVVRARIPRALLLLVPRHPQRFTAVASLLSGRGVRYVARSRGESVSDTAEVLLVDTLGELQMLYAAADAAFVAGSFAPIGGHNLLEPAALGCPIVVGPHNFNAPDIAALFLSRGAAVQVENATALGATIAGLMADPSRREEMAKRAREILEQNRGALKGLLAMIDERLAKHA